MEYLVTPVTEMPYCPSGETLEEMTAREDGLARDPAAGRPPIRLWRLPGQGRGLGL